MYLGPPPHPSLPYTHSGQIILYIHTRNLGTIIPMDRTDMATPPSVYRNWYCNSTHVGYLVTPSFSEGGKRTANTFWGSLVANPDPHSWGMFLASYNNHLTPICIYSYNLLGRDPVWLNLASGIAPLRGNKITHNSNILEGKSYWET